MSVWWRAAVVVLLVGALLVPASSWAQARGGRTSVVAAKRLVVSLQARGERMSPAPERLVLRPRAGALLSGNVVRIVIRAGNEWNDLNASLNGVQIGQEFGRAGNGRRVLLASASHGLRIGKNVLRVGGTSTSFRLVRRHRGKPLPLAGAGRDLRVPVGMAARIVGSIRFAHSCHCTPRVRWTVVSAPAGSHFAKHPLIGAPPVKLLAPLASPLVAVRTVSVSLRGLGRAASPITLLRPDVRGPYVVQLTVSARRLPTVTDQTILDGVPRNPVATVDTQASVGAVPGIQFVDKVFPAPPMESVNGNSVWSGTTSAGVNFHALWQILAVDRATLAPLSDTSGQVWNRTYGACSTGGSSYVCRIGADNTPQEANVQTDLAALGPQAMVIAASQPAGSSASDHWGQPNELHFATGALTEIGFPSDLAMVGQSTASIELAGTPAGGAAAIGVPGMFPGTGNSDIVPNGRADMHGYLGADPNLHFSFMPSQRPQFDLWGQLTSCTSGTCLVSQPGVQGSALSVTNGDGGYVASAYDGHTMQWQTTRWFDTTADDNGANTAALAAFLKQSAGAGNVIMLTSVRTPKLGAVPLADPNTPYSAWWRLAGAVAAIGAHRDTFNRSAASTTGSYALLGWGGAGEANGVDTASSNTGSSGARLRGALVPDRQSLFRPADISTTDQPAERLAQLVLRKPVTTWDSSPGVHAAVDYIGSKVHQLGDTPREAFWHDSLDISSDQTAVKAVQYSSLDHSYNGQAFTAEEFSRAQGKLVTELGWVGNVRDYMSRLAAPQTSTSGNVWEQAQSLQDELEKELSQLNEKAKVEFSWVSVASGLLDLVAALVGAPGVGEEIAKAAETLAATTELGGSLFEGLWSGGSSGSPQDRRVEADQLAMKIQNQDEDVASSYDRMADMILSDPTKLQEVGTYAECNAQGNGCGPNNKYVEYALPIDAQQADVAAAERAIDRTLYESLVPLAFPVWDTGPGFFKDIAEYSCEFGNPWDENPSPAAYTTVLRKLDPSQPAEQPTANPTNNEWETYLMVARSGFTYSFPDETTILDRMFGPVSPSDKPTAGGLGLKAADILPYSQSKYQIPSIDNCGW